jgi:hypothetical protein
MIYDLGFTIDERPDKSRRARLIHALVNRNS